MWKKYKLNPKWEIYNNFMNEGGEGYNPHEKSILIEVEKRQIRQKFYTVAEAEETLAKLKASLPRHTEERMIQGCKECIEIFEYVLKHEKV